MIDVIVLFVIIQNILSALSRIHNGFFRVRFYSRGLGLFNRFADRKLVSRSNASGGNVYNVAVVDASVTGIDTPARSDLNLGLSICLRNDRKA